MLLVDAYNVLHVTGVLPPDLAGLDVEGLAALVARSRWTRKGGRVRMICDGTGRAVGAAPPRSPDKNRARSRFSTSSSLVEIVHAGAGKDADGLIERLLERDTAPRSITVVSSDGRLRSAARKRRAAWLSSEAFLRQLTQDAQSPAQAPAGPNAGRPAVPLSRSEAATWLRLFGLDPDSVGPASQAPAPVPAQPPVVTPDALPRPIDPILRRALEEWTGAIDPADLDMRRWLTDDDHPELQRRLAEALRARAGRSSRPPRSRS